MFRFDTTRTQLSVIQFDKQDASSADASCNQQHLKSANKQSEQEIVRRPNNNQLGTSLHLHQNTSTDIDEHTATLTLTQQHRSIASNAFLARPPNLFF